MFLRRTIPAFVAVTLALALAGCATNPKLVSIAVTPGAGTTVLTATGQTAQYTAIGTFENGKHPSYTQDITGQVTWGATPTAVASISTAGLATAAANGTTTITATDGGVIATSDLTVDITAAGGGGGVGHNLLSVAVIPGSQTLNLPGQTAQFIAIGTFTGTPTSVNLTNLATTTWYSSDQTVANFVTPGSPGLITVTPAGCPTSSCTVYITATGTDANNNTVANLTPSVLTVVPAAVSGTRSLTSLAIIPSAQILNTLGQTSQFIAIGTYSSSPTTQDLTTSATWTSSDNAVATVGSAGTTPATTPGQATAVSCGAPSCTATITAKVTDPVSGDITGSAALTVSPGAATTGVTLTNLTIIPGIGTQTLYAIPQTAQFIALGTFNNGVTSDITNSVTWQSSATNIASISPTGATGGLATSVSCTSPVFPPICSSVITATCPSGNLGCQCLPGSSNTCSPASDVVGTSNLTVEPGSQNPMNPNNLPELNVYTVGAGTGTVASLSPSPTTAIDCKSGSVTDCAGFFTVGETVTPTAQPTLGTFGGFSANCAPVVPATNPASCTITMTGDQTVGAIFN
jgi:hypothetical protein